jgi:hypothetical protein
LRLSQSDNCAQLGRSADAPCPAPKLSHTRRIISPLLAYHIRDAGLLILRCLPTAILITSISPTTTITGRDRFVLTVNGNDFRHDSSVSWNGSLRVTTFVSSHQLRAAITAADIAKPRTVLVSVLNPPGTSTTSVSGAIGMGTNTV